MQAKIPERPFDLDGGADRHRPEDPLESRVAQARRDHDHVLVRRAGDREAAGVALAVGLWRVEQGDVDELAGAVGPVRRLGEAERHRPLGDQVTADQGRLETGQATVAVIRPRSRRGRHSTVIAAPANSREMGQRAAASSTIALKVSRSRSVADATTRKDGLTRRSDDHRHRQATEWQ